MKNIQLTLNVDTIDLIIAGGIAIIALVAVLGFFTWIFKTNKQTRTLEKIDDKLRDSKSRVEVEFVNEKGCEETEEEEAVTEAVQEEAQCTEAEELEETEKATEDNKENDENETDVLEEIQRMIIEESKKKAYVSENFRNNIGKSGKHYSREEVESIIKD